MPVARGGEITTCFAKPTWLWPSELADVHVPNSDGKQLDAAEQLLNLRNAIFKR